MSKNYDDIKPFHHAKEEMYSKDSPTPYATPAFLDTHFLLREELRPVRLQLELLKPELVQKDLNVQATVAIVGSARIPEPTMAQANLKEANIALEKDPKNAELQEKCLILKSILDKSIYYHEARHFAKLVSSHKIDGHQLYVVTGGGPGYMEAANRGAYDIGCKSIAHAVELVYEKKPNDYVTPELTFYFHYFALRKMHFLIRAKAMVAFPGGLGTLDELFETLTLIQTQKIDPIPVILFGKKFWERIIDFQALYEEGTIAKKDLKSFCYVETAEEAWEILNKHYKIHG